MIPILILAAGQSARMRGRDKLAEPVGGVPLLRRQAAMAAEVGDVCVALPRADHPRAALLDGCIEAYEARDDMGAEVDDGAARCEHCGAELKGNGRARGARRRHASAMWPPNCWSSTRAGQHARARR